jgi:hypothetical protein
VSIAAVRRASGARIPIGGESILGCRTCNRPGQDLRISRNEVSRESTKWTCVTGGWEPAPACSQPDLGASSRDFSDTDRIQKTKGLAGNHRLTPVILGSPTWARTRDLRINSRSLGSGCRPRQCSLCGSSASNMFWSVSSTSTGLERRIDYWILESLPPRIPGRSTVLFLDLGMAAEQLHALASRRPSTCRIRDVTLGHYVAKSEAQLRAGWQAVAREEGEICRKSACSASSRW